MPNQVVTGALMECVFGVTPAPLNATSAPTVTIGGMPAATIMDFAPMDNIPTFGMCSSPANPEVASATAAALGVLTPMPCVPATVAPWEPGSATVMIGEFPALNNSCMCNCMWGGVITFTDAGQFTVEIA